MKPIIIRLALTGSGALLGLIGGALIFVPKAFLELSQVSIPSDIGLASELAAPGGLLLIAGSFMVIGAIKRRFASLALTLGAVIYGSYGVGRLISMTFHGLPPEPLVTATVIEFAIAILLGALGLTLRRDESVPPVDGLVGLMGG